MSEFLSIAFVGLIWLGYFIVALLLIGFFNSIVSISKSLKIIAKAAKGLNTSGRTIATIRLDETEMFRDRSEAEATEDESNDA